MGEFDFLRQTRGFACLLKGVILRIMRDPAGVEYTIAPTFSINI